MTFGFETGTSEEDWVVIPRICDYFQENGDDPSQQEDLKIVSYNPAAYWTDAFPVGNGRLGAMVWGGVFDELLQLNEDTLWTGEPTNFTDPDVPTILPQVRKLVREGHFAEASNAAKMMAGKPTEVYQPLGDIELDFGASHKAYDAQSYERELDLDTAKTTVKYVADGVQFKREIFASNPHQVLVVKLSADYKGALSFTVALDRPLHHASHATGKNRIIMEGHCPGKRTPPQQSLYESDSRKGIKFCAILDLQISSEAGSVSIIDDRKLKVDGSNWAVLLLSASSSYDGPFIHPEDSKKDPVSTSLAILDSVQEMTYSQLYTSHLLDYQHLFHRVALHLSKSSAESLDCGTSSSVLKNARVLPCPEMNERTPSKVSTADRVNSFIQDEDPALVTLLFQYGRYLLISSSRPGTFVSNLQGIWSHKIAPAWDGAPHLNINLEMNYWPATSCNLAECQEPLFDLISNLAVNGSKTSQVNYQTGGWVTHHVTDIWAKTSPSDGDPQWAIWPMGGAWLCTHLWEHYSYSNDQDFLKKAYPLLKGCATFLYDWLVKGPDDTLVTNPSTSPEHEFIAPDGKRASVSYATTMDMAITREIFSAIMSAAKILGNVDEDFISKLKTAQNNLFPPKIGRDGCLMEWAEDFRDPEPQHRHMSHLFGLYPGHTITKETTPELCKAAEKSIIKRGEDGPGWSTMWKASLWARLCNSEHAYRMVKKLITLVDPAHEERFEGGLYANLFTAHPPFQIDANFGFSAAIAEILIQSNETELFLLPALPRDKWPHGCVHGLKARGHVSVSLCWKEGKMKKVGLIAERQNQQRILDYDGRRIPVNLHLGIMHVFDHDLKRTKSIPLNGSYEAKASKSSCHII